MHEVSHLLSCLGCLRRFILYRIQSPFTRFLGLDKVSSNAKHFLDSMNTIFSSEVAVIIPQVDDYICIICTDLAFKPS